MNMKGNDFFRKYGIVLVLILMIGFFSLTTESFLTFNNLLNVIRQVSIMGIVAVGMTFVLLTGGLDLSVGALLAVSGVSTSVLIVNYNVNPLLGMAVGVLVTTVLGMITGLIIQRIDLPPMIVTLGMMTITRGLAYIITGGLPIYGLPKEYVKIGQGYIGVIPIPVIFMIIIFLIGGFILNKTYFGRHFYAMGGNLEAARLSGVKVSSLKVVTYLISGFLCGIAGIILMFRINSGQPTAGLGIEMDVITATVLGGVSLTGGEGKIFGVFIGCLIIGVLSNGLIIMNVGEYYQLIVKGMVLILAVSFDKLGQREKIKRVKVS